MTRAAASPCADEPSERGQNRPESDLLREKGRPGPQAARAVDLGRPNCLNGAYA